MNPQGDVIAQHVVLPLHIGAFPACCGAVIRSYDDIAEGDAFLINHPYDGGSPHAPDMAVITPVFFKGELVGFTGSIAHKSDIGGPVPGSCSGQAKETFNEGLHLPAVRYQHKYVENKEILRIVAANSRTPELVLGDIRGQLGSSRLGEQRLGELIGKFGRDNAVACFARLIELAEQRMRAAIAEWKDGRYEAERFVDDDGVDAGKPVRIHVVVEKKGEQIRFDFSGSADQTKGPANIRPPTVRAAIGYVLVSLIDPNTFINSGVLRAFDINAREGSVLNPRFPAPVNTYNPTVHALVEALYGALTDIVPDMARADGCGSRSIILGGRSTYTGKGYVQYEILGGGGGARAKKDGQSGTSVNQSNAKIAPIEIIESEFPTRVLRFELIPDSGGAGQYRGGLGIRREYLNLEDARFSIRSTKHVIAPEGAARGGKGRGGRVQRGNEAASAGAAAGPGGPAAASHGPVDLVHPHARQLRGVGAGGRGPRARVQLLAIVELRSARSHAARGGAEVGIEALHARQHHVARVVRVGNGHQGGRGRGRERDRGRDGAAGGDRVGLRGGVGDGGRGAGGEAGRDGARDGQGDREGASDGARGGDGHRGGHAARARGRGRLGRAR
jgi:N-methylhydantoinase B